MLTRVYGIDLCRVPTHRSYVEYSPAIGQYEMNWLRRVSLLSNATWTWNLAIEKNCFLVACLFLCASYFQVLKSQNIFHFRHNDVVKRSLDSSSYHHDKLINHVKVCFSIFLFCIFSWQCRALFQARELRCISLHEKILIRSNKAYKQTSFDE